MANSSWSCVYLCCTISLFYIPLSLTIDNFFLTINLVMCISVSYWCIIFFSSLNAIIVASFSGLWMAHSVHVCWIVQWDVCACWQCLEQHMRGPYVYEEMVGMQLVNRLFNTQTTHTQFPGTCRVNSMLNPSFAHQATVLHLTSSILHPVVTLRANPN